MKLSIRHECSAAVRNIWRLAAHFHTSLFSYKCFINNSSCNTFICTLGDRASDICTGLSQLRTLRHHVALSEGDIHGAQTSPAVPWVLLMRAGNQVSTGAKLHNMFNDNVPFSTGSKWQLWFDEGQVCLTTTLTCLYVHERKEPLRQTWTSMKLFINIWLRLVKWLLLTWSILELYYYLTLF